MIQTKINTPNFFDSFVLGSILGDAHIQKNRSKTGKYRLRIGHALKQKEYVLWKYKVLFDYVLQAPVVDKKSKQRNYPFLHFSTRYDDIWTKYHKIFYKESNGIKIGTKGIQYQKIIPENIDQLLLDPFSLLVWYCDDGSRRSDCAAARIATHSFSLDENILLKNCLFKNFGLECSVVKAGISKKTKKQYYSLSIPAKTFVQFRELVRPLILANIPSMDYKCK